MTGIESLDERLTAALARRDAAIDVLCHALVTIDAASRDVDDLIDDRCTTPP